ncbi:MAG: cytochrome c [Pedobacter sp.]|nr:cytochrome c [Pedobacter sp.]
MKKITVLGIIACLIAFMAACGGNSSPENSATTSAPSSGASSDVAKYDPERGKGKFTTMELGPIDAARVENGLKVFDVKCSSCHKLTDEKLVGPGWAGVTKRNKPVWIMNFITNPDAMIDVDPKLQAQLELCLVRMPNQNLSDTDARNLVEFMRKNDGEK